MGILRRFSVIFGLLLANLAIAATPAKLSPQMRPISGSDGYSIDIEELQPFITPLYIIPTQVFMGLPRISNFDQDRLMADAGDNVLVSGINSSEVEFDILEAGEPVIDPDTKSSPGVLIYAIAKATMIDYGKISKLRIDSSLSPVYPGYRIMPTNFQLPASIKAFTPEVPFYGKIIALPNALSMKGDYQQVVLNIGSEQGLSEGMILKIYSNKATQKFAKRNKSKGTWQGQNKSHMQEEGKDYRNISMTDPIGDLLVYSSLPGYSFGLVLKASKPIHKNDFVVSK